MTYQEWLSLVREILIARIKDVPGFRRGEHELGSVGLLQAFPSDWSKDGRMVLTFEVATHNGSEVSVRYMRPAVVEDRATAPVVVRCAPQRSERRLPLTPEGADKMAAILIGYLFTRDLPDQPLDSSQD